MQFNIFGENTDCVVCTLGQCIEQSSRVYVRYSVQHILYSTPLYVMLCIIIITYKRIMSNKLFESEYNIVEISKIVECMSVLDQDMRSTFKFLTTKQSFLLFEHKTRRIGIRRKHDKEKLPIIAGKQFLHIKFKIIPKCLKEVYGEETFFDLILAI